MTDESLLDNPAWHSLIGPHAGLARVHGDARAYPADVSPFTALPVGNPPEAWADLAALVGPAGVAVMTGDAREPGSGWEVLQAGEGVQYVDISVDAAPDPEAVRLGERDAAEMLALVERTKPGPFLPRTWLLGTYLGLRHEGRLVAMAGERLHPRGWTEISAVCTDAEARGRGLASRLVKAVAFNIHQRGDRPFLHTGASNPARSLYEQLGFKMRRHTAFAAYRLQGNE